jgi:hypothetical protein
LVSEINAEDKSTAFRADSHLESRGPEVGRLDREVLVAGMGGTVRATGTAGLGASAKSIVHDSLDGPGAAAALGAASKTAINIPRRARQLAGSRGDGRTNVVVSQDIAGADNHGREKSGSDAALLVFKARPGCKRKSRCFKLFQTE